MLLSSAEIPTPGQGGGFEGAKGSTQVPQSYHQACARAGQPRVGRFVGVFLSCTGSMTCAFLKDVLFSASTLIIVFLTRVEMRPGSTVCLNKAQQARGAQSATPSQPMRAPSFVHHCQAPWSPPTSMRSAERTGW